MNNNRYWVRLSDRKRKECNGTLREAYYKARHIARYNIFCFYGTIYNDNGKPVYTVYENGTIEKYDREKDSLIVRM